MASMARRVEQRRSKKRKKTDSAAGSAAGSAASGPCASKGLNSGVLIMSRSRLGSGSYGTVVKGTFHNPDKIITNYEGIPLSPEFTYGIKSQDKRETEHEVQILRRLGNQSDYIMTLYGTAKPPDGDDNYLLMVVEKLDTTLAQHFKYSIQRRRTGFVRKAFQMFEAVAFLESKQVVHLDLHGGNIMFKGDDPVLIDFGLAEVTGGGSIIPFTDVRLESWRHWHPPEQRVWDGQTCKYAPVTTKYDVFSIAVNLLNLIYDPKKNDTRLGSFKFHYFITLALLKTNNIDFRFETLDQRLKDGLQTGDVSSVEIVSPAIPATLSTMYTCFRAGRHPILQLHMPGNLAELFKRCLFYERWRPLASKMVKDLDSMYPSATSQFYVVFPDDDDHLQGATLRF